MAYYARYGFQGIIPKPYTMEMLSAALHRALMVPSDVAFLQEAEASAARPTMQVK
jgi:hypothetical protein